MNPIHIPAKLNGYDIVAAASNMPGTNCGFDDQAMVILGHDPSRRTGKYVTALVDSRPTSCLPGDVPREWYVGHYFEDQYRAVKDFLERTGMIYWVEQLDAAQTYPIVTLPEGARA